MDGDADYWMMRIALRWRLPHTMNSGWRQLKDGFAEWVAKPYFRVYI